MWLTDGVRPGCKNVVRWRKRLAINNGPVLIGAKSSQPGDQISRPDPNRRDFTKLAAAAFGGLVAGTALAEDKKEEKKNPLLSDKHICRRLNKCKGKGAGGKNECAGKARAPRQQSTNVPS